MRLIKSKIKLKEIKKIADRNMFTLVKAVVDIDQRVMAIGGELHADEERLLLENGSKQKNLWGINLYPDKYNSDDFIEYDSMINLRPNDNNLTRGVDDKKIRQKIREIVEELISNEK